MDTDNKTITFVVWIFTVIGLIAVWRGIWGLLDHYFLPKRIMLSRVLSILIGLVIIIVVYSIYNTINII